jgi:hypothetical protein
VQVFGDLPIFLGKTHPRLGQVPRSSYRTMCAVVILRQAAVVVAEIVAGMARLAELGDASDSYDWGLFLSLCKSSGLSTNCVGAREPPAVLVKHRNLPVVVLPPCVFPE